MKRVLLICCLTLGGCGGGQPTQTAASPAQTECERAAYDDPKVISLREQATITATWLGTNFHRELVDAQKQATLRCLRARGLAPKGGVEPEQIQY